MTKEASLMPAEISAQLQAHQISLKDINWCQLLNCRWKGHRCGLQQRVQKLPTAAAKREEAVRLLEIMDQNPDLLQDICRRQIFGY